MVVTRGAQLLSAKSALSLPWQQKAWRFYGPPDDTEAANVRSNQGAIGEVRFVIGWIAQQIGRINWDVEIDGKLLERAESNELMLKIANEESTIIVATNLMVAGELGYIALTPQKFEMLSKLPGYDELAGPNFPESDDSIWLAVSVIDKNRAKMLEEASLSIRGIWPHPGMPTKVDPPLRGVIDVLEEIEQLQDVAFSQNRSRVAQMGILTVATEFDLATPGGDFGQRLEDAINAPIADPRKSSASPILIRGPFELMTGSLSNGARGVQWTKPVQDFDERIDDKMKFQIQRLAYGFPVAPEILLGMTATNRAVAFQIEESTYRSHVEPICNIVGRIYAKALKLIYENKDAKIRVKPDATDLLARRHSVADAKDLYDRGIVGAPYVRHVAGVSDEWEATDDDLHRIVFLRKGTNEEHAREADPSEVSGNEPVRASASLEDLTASLRGAVDMAMTTAISRIGAAARTRMTRQFPTPELGVDPDGVPNSRLPSMLGPDRLAALELDLDGAICVPMDSLASWWRAQLDGMDDDVVDESVETLRQFFRHQCANLSCAWPIVPVRDDFTRPVVAALRPPVLESVTESGGD